MSKEQINIAIAEACGWFNCILPSQDEYHLMTDLELGRAMGKPVGRNFSLHGDGLHYPLPNYCNDLNSMHEAEKVLNDNQQQKYLYLLWDTRGVFVAITANANQRAESFLKTIGKWEGGK
jgi:hypothetical protein